MMKKKITNLFICINVDQFSWHDFIIGKQYTIIEESYQLTSVDFVYNNVIFYFIDDDGIHQHLPKNHIKDYFITLDEWREQQLSYLEII